MENNHLFIKNFAWYLVLFCKNDESKHKFFWNLRGIKHPPLMLLCLTHYNTNLIHDGDGHLIHDGENRLTDLDKTSTFAKGLFGYGW
jgi:hypothetical protein